MSNQIAGRLYTVCSCERLDGRCDMHGWPESGTTLRGYCEVRDEDNLPCELLVGHPGRCLIID